MVLFHYDHQFLRHYPKWLEEVQDTVSYNLKFYYCLTISFYFFMKINIYKQIKKSIFTEKTSMIHAGLLIFTYIYILRKLRWMTRFCKDILHYCYERVLTCCLWKIIRLHEWRRKIIKAPCRNIFFIE